MSILQRIEADLITARKASDAKTRDALVFLLSEARAPGKNKGNRESTDEEVMVVIRRLIGSARETLSAIENTPRAGEGAAIQEDIDRLTGYLPAQMSETELTTLIESFITGQNWTDEKKSLKWMGSVMSMLRDCHPGEYDPTLASQVARRLLSTP